MSVTPYLFFNGRCEEAIAFYKLALGAEVDTLMRFSDAPQSPDTKEPPRHGDKIMHASLKIRGSQIMASDGMCSGEAPKFAGCALSIEVPDPATADTLFGAVAEGGQVQQPLIETFFASRFGVAVDKFGVSWMVVAAPQT